MKKTMVLFGIVVSLLVGCSDVEKKEEVKPKQVTETKTEEKTKEQEVTLASDEKQKLELPTMKLNEILLGNVDEIKQGFLKAGMTEKEGTYTYGDITIDSMKEKGDSIYFKLTFKESVSDSDRYDALDSFGIKNSVTISDNVTFTESNDKVKKHINWKVVEKRNGKTKQIAFRADKL